MYVESSNRTVIMSFLSAHNIYARVYYEIILMFQENDFLSGVISPDTFFLPKYVCVIKYFQCKSVAEQAPSRVRFSYKD